MGHDGIRRARAGSHPVSQSLWLEMLEKLLEF